jgi:uncharacterized protein
MIRAFAVCAALLPVASAVAALPIPKLQGPVNDYAGIIPPDQQQQLSRFLSDQEEKTSNQIVVLTVKSLEGDQIDSFAFRVANNWKLGKKGKDNGVLLVVAVKDHKAFIEVGRGLQGVLTDVLSSRIVRNEMAPSFKAGNYGQGLIDGVAAIDKAIHGEYHGDPHGGNPNPFTMLLLYFLFFLFLMWIAGKMNRSYGRFSRAWPPVGGWSTGGWSGDFGSFGGSSGGSGGGGFGGYSGGGGSFDGGGGGGSW